MSTTYNSQSLTKSLEQRWNAIEDIFPCDDRPVTTAAEKIPGKNSIISWVEENITLTTAANKKVEGADYSYASNTAAKRTNYVQKIQNGDTVTDLNDLSEHPEIGGTNARKSRVKYLVMEQSLLDLEWSLINSTAAIGNNSTAAEMAGLIAQCGSAYTSAAPTTSGTSAARRTITYNTENSTGGAAATTSLVTMLGKNWTDGGKIKRLLVNYNQKTAQFDTFTVAGYQRNTNLAESGKGSAVLTYEKVVTAAGPVEVIPHPMVANGAMVGYDPRAFKVVEVQEFKSDPKVARTGDADKISVFGYYSSKLMNQKAAMYAVNYTGIAVP